MQPENTTEGNIQANTTNTANTTTVTNTGAAPQAPQSQPTTTTAPAQDIVFRDKPKKNPAMIFGMVFLAILAACGIGFGVWTMMDSDTKTKNLNDQISTLKQQNNELQEKLDNTSSTTTSNDSTETTDTKNYIYIGEWGTKIKVPETLDNVSYVINNWDEGNFAGTSLCVTGATTGHNGATPSFVKFMVNDGMYVCLGKNTKSISTEEGGAGNQIFPVGEFYIQGPQAVAGDGSDTDWEVESANAIKNMLSEENMSKI